MRNKIREIMANVFEIPVEQLPGSFAQSDIHVWDSLRHLNLIVELEAELDISFEPEEISEMITSDKVIEICTQKTLVNI